MASYYVQQQDFGWGVNDSDRYDENNIRSAPRPRIALINTHDKWYEFDRTGMDAVIYWTTEALANERSWGYPIVPLSDKDYVYSSSNGPNNTVNLHFWLQYMADVYNKKWFNKLMPALMIKENRMACALGSGRLSRTYAWCKMHEMGLIDDNLISFVSDSYKWAADADPTNELPGIDEMMRYTRSNWSKIPTSPVRFEDEWRRFKNSDNWHHETVAGTLIWAIIPTKVYEKSSVLFTMETLLNNDEFFMTEKTCKALLSGRPSAIVACRNNLDHIKELGFKTWDGILDESYQYLERPKDRIDTALRAVSNYLKVNVLNDSYKLDQIRSIAEHNRKHLLESDWAKNIRDTTAMLKKKFEIE